MPLLAPEDHAALTVLRECLGLRRALWLAARLRWQEARGRPFRDLPGADDERERESRAQAGGAVLLYRLLREQLETEAALSLTGRVVHASALAFLGRTVGPVGPDELAERSQDERLAFVQGRLARFPNVDATVDAVSAGGVRFTVHRCRLVSLVRQAGHPELAPLFCSADADFFGGQRSGMTLERPTTLAAGGPACDFHIFRAEDP